jgi:hypothetical protein
MLPAMSCCSRPAIFRNLSAKLSDMIMIMSEIGYSWQDWRDPDN